MFEYSALKDKINEALNEGVIGGEKNYSRRFAMVSRFIWNSNTITILNVLYSNVKF
jgi:hypothetical protein